MALYNLMTCENFSGSFLACGLAWLPLALIIFLALILKRQAEDGFLSGMDWDIYGSIGVGLALAVLVVTLTGDARWELLAGLGGMAAGGILIGKFTGGE